MIRRMRSGDIASAMRLKAAANWNQTTHDWKRLLRLDPEGCFVDERGGSVVGSTTALRHGQDLAWIGMVLVLPAFRRMGVARGLVQHALGWLRDCGNLICGLDATTMGHPLYAQLGFADDSRIERWERVAGAVPSPGEQRGAEKPVELSGMLEGIDRQACGYDRSHLLRDLCRDSTVDGTTSEAGFAFARPGSSARFIGPCISTDKRRAAEMLRELLEGTENQPVIWDLLPANSSARGLASELGFRPVRQLTRMLLHETRVQPPHAQLGQIYATAGFEFG